MHTEPMPETAGTLNAEWKSLKPCRRCTRAEVVVEEWSSSCGGYEDEKHTCKACGHTRWIEGPDA